MAIKADVSTQDNLFQKLLDVETSSEDLNDISDLVVNIKEIESLLTEAEFWQTEVMKLIVYRKLVHEENVRKIHRVEKELLLEFIP